MSRKHVKIEPQRWYYWCDKLGLLVWQDMPSSSHAVSQEKYWKQFWLEMPEMIDQRYNHPSIVSWVLFNEGWGIGQQVAKGDFRLKKNEWFDLKAVTAKAIALDPTRLINHESGAGGGPNQGNEAPSCFQPRDTWWETMLASREALAEEEAAAERLAEANRRADPALKAFQPLRVQLTSQQEPRKIKVRIAGTACSCVV